MSEGRTRDAPRSALDSLAVDRAYRSALATAMAQIEESAAAYAKEKKITPRDCGKET